MVPVKHPHEYVFTPNDSMYARVVQKILNDAGDSRLSPFAPKNIKDSRR